MFCQNAGAAGASPSAFAPVYVVIEIIDIVAIGFVLRKRSRSRWRSLRHAWRA
jgi:hypothetical protein